MEKTLKKFPNTSSNGTGTFSDDLVGFQLVEGGGLTQGNFAFKTTITEKVNREFNIGSFSDPITLDSLNFASITESRIIIAKEFNVYPNFDLSEITKFNLYGSLSKRLSASVSKIINFFPAALEVYSLSYDFTNKNTAINCVYDSVENVTTFEVSVDNMNNPFGIDYSVNATRNLSLKENEVSYLRNLTTQYSNYSLFLNEVEYQVYFFTPSQSLYSGTIEFTIYGDPFSGQSYSNDTLIIRPNSYYSDKSFVEPFDEVEEFLLNRLIVPKYTATFQVPRQTDDGLTFIDTQNITWPLDGQWNLDIRTKGFENYLKTLNEVAISFDDSKTNLIARFLTTDAFKEFDTEDRKVNKMLTIYGRNFDEVKKYIDALAHMNSVNYIIKNDVPSQLLKNLAETLGWKTNISPATNEDLLDSIFKTTKPQFEGYSRNETPTELNYQYYRNLILNSAYLFNSKGTRKSIELLLRLIGAPEALIEFNENIYTAGQRINMGEFDKQYYNLNGGVYTEEIPIYDSQTYKIQGKTFSAYTSQVTDINAEIYRNEYPVNDLGFPKAPNDDEGFFFQKGAGWFELVKDHQSPQVINYTNSVFTGQNFNIQTQFEEFTYGQKYLDRYRNFPYMNHGFRLYRMPDNKKSWPVSDVGLRVGNGNSGYDAYYFTSDDRLIMNVKNIDLFLNPAQGLLYDVWSMSRKYNYPIPSSGLSAPYPQPGGADWTVINPKPSKQSFFEFAQTFWNNTINARDRLYSSDGKTSGYPALQAIFWQYLTSKQTIGIPNDNFTYRSMIDYVTGLGDYWIRLVEQMIPATTIWMGGIKYENSIFHRQKFAYRIQRGCYLIPVPCEPCSIDSQIFLNTCTDETISCSIYPWSNPSVTVQTFKDILYQTVTNYITSNSLTCDLNSLETDWYIDLRLDGNIVAKTYISTTYGLDGITNDFWKTNLELYVPPLSDQYLTYEINGDLLYVYNTGCFPMFENKQIQLNVGLDFKLNCS